MERGDLLLRRLREIRAPLQIGAEPPSEIRLEGQSFRLEEHALAEVTAREADGQARSATYAYALWLGPDPKALLAEHWAGEERWFLCERLEEPV